MKSKESKSGSLGNTSKKSQGMYDRIRKIIEDARGNIVRAVNTEMVVAYWQIGKEIVEEEQRGKSRAGYGKKLLEGLAKRLSDDFGKGFDDSNLWNMRKFYQTYPILDAVRRELSWTHYRILMRVEKPQARSFYEIECVKNNGKTGTDTPFLKYNAINKNSGDIILKLD